LCWVWRFCYLPQKEVTLRAVATGGGVISVYIPPNQSTLNFLCGCFVSLQWLVNIYTHPNQIPGYASGYTFISLQQLYTASQKKDPRHYRLPLEEGLSDFNNFWYEYSGQNWPPNDCSSSHDGSSFTRGNKCRDTCSRVTWVVDKEHFRCLHLFVNKYVYCSWPNYSAFSMFFFWLMLLYNADEARLLQTQLCERLSAGWIVMVGAAIFIQWISNASAAEQLSNPCSSTVCGVWQWLHLK